MLPIIFLVYPYLDTSFKTIFKQNYELSDLMHSVITASDHSAGVSLETPTTVVGRLEIEHTFKQIIKNYLFYKIFTYLEQNIIKRLCRVQRTILFGSDYMYISTFFLKLVSVWLLELYQRLSTLNFGKTACTNSRLDLRIFILHYTSIRNINQLVFFYAAGIYILVKLESIEVLSALGRILDLGSFPYFLLPNYLDHFF